ncbi:MAG: outer membrane beta-barrel domain-containing protein [Bdellovibrionota bacterium]
MLKLNVIGCLTFLLTISFELFPPVMASESDTYDFTWLDPDKEVYVLQNRKFRKKGSLSLHVGGGKTTSGAFVDSLTMQGRANYFFFEEWGIEFLYAKNTGEENSTAMSVRNPGGPGSRPFRRIVSDYKAVMALWSPFYAKINTFNQILYFDWIFGLGLTELNEHNNREEFQSGGVGSFAEKNEKHNGAIWEVGLQFYINPSWDLRLDFTGTHYKAQKALSTAATGDEAYYSNYDLSLSLGYRF